MNSTPATESANPAPLRDGHGTRVLVVDDNPDLVDGLVMLLRMDGIDARGAYGADQALRIAAAWPPHACVLDISMPAMDGYELAARLRSCSPDPRRLRLIAQTGWDIESAARRCAQAGFFACLQKPVDWSELSGLLAAESRTEDRTE